MTPIQKAGLARLKLRWPERRLELDRVTEWQILDLYESYEEVSLAFDNWAREAQPAEVAIADDYRLIILELEQEIAFALTR